MLENKLEITNEVELSKEEEIAAAKNNIEFDHMTHSYVLDPFSDEKILSFSGTIVDFYSAFIYAASEREEEYLDSILQVAKGTSEMDTFTSLHGHSIILKKWNTSPSKK